MHLLLGALAWILAIVLKRALYLAFRRFVITLVVAHAALRGVISAATELGLSAAFFATASLRWSLDAVYTFGTGAAVAEFAILIFRRHRLRKGRALGEPPLIQAQFWVERICASILHVGARCLVFLAVIRHTVAAGVIAFVSFVLVDGVAAFGKLHGWRWTAPHTAYSYYAFVTAVGVANIILFQLFY